MNEQREQLGSRIGFLLLSAGCAIGLGNIWRFPYICGANGGAIFVLFYFIFLAILGFPVMLMELSVGRAGQAYMGGAFKRLQPENRSFPALSSAFYLLSSFICSLAFTIVLSMLLNFPIRFKYVLAVWITKLFIDFKIGTNTDKLQDAPFPWSKLAGSAYLVGNFALMMFYFIVTGWLFYYTYSYFTGVFNTMTPEQIPGIFPSLIASWQKQFIFGGVALFLTIAVCMSGLKNSIERATKILMAILFLLMIAMTIKALSLPKAGEGVAFFLKPDFAVLKDGSKILNAMHAAMTQAFFTLSLGIGSIAIFGSYIDKTHSLAKESLIIIGLDTFVAVCAGLIIFPCCACYGVQSNGGPGLIFNTLPRIFLEMPKGNIAGACFFLFLSIAAFTTLIAVTENLIAGAIDGMKLSRTKASLLVGGALLILCMPCALGFNVWSGFQPLGKGSSIMDLEDFIVSDNLLPLGALLYCLFCTRRQGWGAQNWLTEVNTGKGLKFSPILLPYCKYVLPILILAIWIIGLVKKF